MTIGRPEATETIEVYTGGCALGARALAALEEAARGTTSRIVERPIAALGTGALEAAGVTATPAVVAHGTVRHVGVPTAAQARSIVRRAHLDQVVLEWSIPKSDAVQRFVAGEGASERVAKALATEFYAFSHEFPLFLAACISHVKDEQSRILLVHNLYEEHGNLELARVHPRLFRQFVAAMGFQSEALETYRAGSPGTEAAQWVTAICREGPANRALGALYVTELLFGPTCVALMKGLGRLGLSAEATEFFSLHAVAEEHHKEQLWHGIDKVCTSEADFRTTVHVASDVAHMFYTLFDYIARSDYQTTSEELAVFGKVREICGASPFASRWPVAHKDAAYYFGITLGGADAWFLRALCDADGRSLLTRLSVDEARTLSRDFQVEPAPGVLGRSRVYFRSPADVEALAPLVLAAYEREAGRLDDMVRAVS